jgi:hypothetical protein
MKLQPVKREAKIINLLEILFNDLNWLQPRSTEMERETRPHSDELLQLIQKS